MKKIKDFIYNTNDIIIAVLILVIAAAIILWRLGIILDYPKTLVHDGHVSDTTGTLTVPEDKTDDGNDVQMPGDQAGTEGEDSEEGEQTGEGEEPSDVDEPAPSGSLWDGDTLTKEVKVDVQGNSATAAIKCLVEAGIFESYDDYAKQCKDLGYNPEHVRGGVMTFEKGTTRADVIKKVSWK